MFIYRITMRSLGYYDLKVNNIKRAIEIFLNNYKFELEDILRIEEIS